MANRNVSQKTSSISNDNQKSGAFKKLMMTSALTAAGFIGIVGIAEAGTSTPTDGTTVYGSSTTTKSGDTYTTNQDTNIAISEYQYSLLLDGHETWNINQPGAGSLSAHRILTMDADPSRILGVLNSNGRVLIIDPNGVFFGPGSRVDVAGIVTTTGDIDNAQIVGNEFGDYTIENINTGAIDLQGQISVSEAGLAAFVAPTVKNAGIIKAKLGKIVMASGEKVTLDLYGDNLVEIEVAGGAEALVENTGEIIAEGGEVHMTAAAAKQAVDNIINVDGIVSASSATMQGGKIVLGGGDSGTVKVAGKVEAKGTNGGSVEIKGENVHVAQSGNIDASANELGDGGEIIAIAEKDGYYEGTLKAEGGILGGNGGFIETSGLETLGVTEFATVSAAAYAGGQAGTWLLDPQNIRIRNGADDDTNSNLRFVSAATLQTSLNGSGTNISLVTANPVGSTSLGDILFDAMVSWNSAATFTVDAANNVVFRNGGGIDAQGTGGFTALAGAKFRMNTGNLGITTASGDVNITAGEDIFITTGNINAGSGNVTLNGNSLYRQASGVSVSGANISIAADQFILVDATSTLNATNVVTINRETLGDVSVGDENGGLEITQAELNNITAASLVIGDAGTAQNITVENANFSGVTLPAPGLNNVSLTANEAINFSGLNNSVNLDATASEINVLDGAVVATGGVDFDASVVNLNADISSSNITGTANTVNIQSNSAQIQDGIDVAASGGTVTVSDGTYSENITINKALSLLSENGRGSTTIEGISGVNALGTVVFKPNTSGVQLGDTGQGFTIVGIDNGSAGIENAAVYLQGNQSNHLIKGNDIVANGDAGLLSEYGATVSNITIDGNIFSGQTFQGANPAGNGFGSQFTLNNVPRQLITMGGGTGGGNTSNITFSNNEITGTAGGLNTSGQEQGNTLVTIDADNSSVTGNTFAGTTARYATSLRARGDGTLISGNTFHAAGLTDSTGHLYVTNNVYTGIAGQDDIIDIWNSNTFVGRATVSSDDVSATTDGIGLTIGGAVAASNAGATVFINEATYQEGNINIDKNLLISGAGKGKTVVDATGFANGFIINSDLGNTNTTIRRLSVNNASQAGLRVFDTANLKVLTLNQTSFENNGYNGVAVYGNSMKELRILNSDFKSNGGANGSSGDGDILAYLYNGDITLNNVNVEGDTAANTADYGIQIRGEGSSSTVTPSGTITMNNVNVSGNYRAALLGIQRYSDLDLSMTDVSLGGSTTAGTQSTGWGSLYLSELGNGDIDIGNTAFGAVNGQYILLGAGSTYATPNAVDATGATFEGVNGATATTAQNFAIEDKIFHKMDLASQGLVTWANAGEFFVTGNTLGIQNAIDLANAGATVNVDGSTYTEDLVINKALKLTGHGTTLQSAGGASLITVTAADVNIDPFAFVGDGTTTLYGINATGANNLIVDGNSFTGFVNASINVENSNDVKIFGNTITGGQKGINGDAISNAQIHTNTINGTTVAGIHVANSGGTGYDGAGKDVDIWSNTITSADGRGILIQNSDFVTIGADALNPFASGYAGGNIISGGYRGIEVDDTDNAQIIFNTVDNIGNLGISINNNNDTIVSKNKVGTTGGVDNIGANGIGAYDSANTLIDSNIVTQTRGAGIAVHYASSGSVISNNDIDDINREGIYVDSDNVTIDNNNVDTTGLHAVVVATSNGSKVINNKIGTTGGADNIGQNGISIFGSAGTLVDNNIVTQTTNAGIVVTGASAGTTVSNNDIDDVNREGIYTSTAGVIIDSNTIDKTGLDGISLSGSTGSQVLNNKIGTSGGPLNIKGDGIYAVNSDDIVITGNKVERTDSTASNKGNGIKVVSSDNAVIGGTGTDQNIVNNVKWDGISVIGGDNVTIDNNKVTKAQRAGIYAENLTNSAITNNTIDQTTQFRGIGLNGGNFVTVSGNTIDNTALDGIYSRNVQNVTIASNLIGTVSGNIGANGILVDAGNATNTNVIGNTISNVADHGIAFTGGINGGKVNVITNAINASKNGIDFDGALSDGTVEIGVNTINANENGVVFADNIINSNVYFGGNRGNGFGYQVINAGKSGIVFNGDLTNSYVGMPRQQVTALDGDAVRFEGGLIGTRVGVGYGEGEFINGAPLWVSNVGGFFTGSDNGVVFASDVTSGSLIEINSTAITGQGGDGVRFGGDVDGSEVLVSSANIKGLNGSGIVVAGHVTNGSTFEISNAETSDTPKFGPNIYGVGAGNTITGTTNGIEFNGIDGSSVTIANNASITGGDNGILFGAGSPSVVNSNVVIDNNTLIEGDNSIQFADRITGTSSVEITNNDLINGTSGDGILFAGQVDADNGTQREVYIADNAMIRGSSNGIRSGWFTDAEHDTLIKNNTIEGLGNAGILLGGSISGAHVRIVSNDIEGRFDGINLNGNVRNAGILAINKNTSINGRFDDGVDVGGAATGGVIRIAQNDSITGLNNGIEANGTFNRSTLNINDNGYIYGFIDGVHVEGTLSGGSKIIVKDNGDIQSGIGDGVEIRNTGFLSFGADVRVVGNTISDVGSNGVNLYRVSGATVSGNQISQAGNDGIHVERSWNTKIHDNQISSVLGDGIDLENSNFASIRRNIVLLAAGNGILLNDSEASVIARNLIAIVGDDGIDVEDSSFTQIVQNFIGLTGDDGIEVENSHFVDVKRNLIALVSDDGIDVDNSFGANIERNIIFLAGDNGIEVEGSNNADILNNRIGLVGGNGILVGGSNNAEINRNQIQFVRENGVAVYGGSNNSATNNLVNNVGGNGVAFFGVNGFDISGNRVRNAYNGINVVGSNDGTIEANVTNRNRNNGINVEGTNTFTISGNTAKRNDIGLGIYGSSNGLVDGNDFSNNRDYGIHLGGGFGPKGPPTTTATIGPVAVALRLPLAPTGVSDITITNNTISNNRDIGLFAEGENHGSITLAGNDFIDNPVGARFESGAIDLSDLTNPNNFINTNPLALPIGMQFDGSPEKLTIVGETIGATTFEGFLNAGSFYVRFEDGSILDPVTGAPIVINGVGGTYDGINPALTGGALTPDILAFLEARIFDADDALVNGRGQLFVGFVPDAATLENIEDFFNTFGAFNGGGNGASVTIAGLPFINAPNNPGFGAPNANFFANLEPAAGEESTDPNDLANLEPAAGGEESETSCWGDAVNAASNGQVASFSFGGSFENSIAQASAGCQSASAQ